MRVAMYNFQRRRGGVDGKKNHMYIAALFWSVQTLTTVGYGNVVPTTVSERVIAIIVMITEGLRVFRNHLRREHVHG